MKYFLRTFLILLTAGVMVSCVERINISLDSSYVRLVVDGSFTTDSILQTVTLTETSSYYFNQPPPPVQGATVQISDGAGTFDLKEDLPGVYHTDTAVKGIPGMTYTLNIKLAEPIGGYSEYTATSTLYPVNSLDSVGLTFHPDWAENGIWEVKCYVQDPPTTDFYRFMIFKNNYPLTDSLNEWFVTDDRFFNGNYANGAPIAYLRQSVDDEKLQTGDTISVELNSIGSGYANFIWEAQAEVNGTNPLFSGPPSNVKGNINNGAVGFFAAYSVTRAYTIVADTL
jgi:hypothetical protein